jgi:prepilin-type N-terminal cleavage/methylation domain-containing protein
MRARLNRRGFTAVELLVVLAIGGVVTGAIVGVLRRQQRFFTSASVLVGQRISLRDATGILPGELRALAPASGDVIAFSDSALEIRATVGSAIVCDTLRSGEAVALAPSRAAREAALSAYSSTPQPGDVALLYDPGVPDIATDDAWVAREITDVASSASVCATSPFVDPADPTAARLVMQFRPGDAIPATVAPGAFVRVLRRVRYRLYRAGTGDWVLGYSEWDGTTYSVVQPVSGPFAPYSRGGTGGLTLRYYDTFGVELTPGDDAMRIASLALTVRGSSRESLASTAVRLADSQTVAIGIRNR